MTQTKLRFTTIDRMGTVVVLRPKRRLTGDDETEELRQIVQELNAEKLHCLVINLSDVDWLATPGITALVEAHKRFSERGAHIHLTGVGKRIHNVFLVTKLVLVFDTYPTEEEAVAGCTQKSAPEH